MKESPADSERRRQRIAGAFHLAAALVKVYGESDDGVATRGINSLRVASEAVRLTDALLQRLEDSWEPKGQ